MFMYLLVDHLVPAMGGRIVAENFRIASALEALSINAQTAPFVLKDVTGFRQRIIREFQ